MAHEVSYLIVKLVAKQMKSHTLEKTDFTRLP